MPADIMYNTTLCYLERDGQYLMLHRVKKNEDINKGKWIGVGGKFEEGESPEDCVIREVWEETALHVQNLRLRGVITFIADHQPTEYMFLYTADQFTGTMIRGEDCAEGILHWVDKDKISSLPIWEGDRIFLRLLEENAPFFSLKLRYINGQLTEAVLNGTSLPA